MVWVLLIAAGVGFFQGLKRSVPAAIGYALLAALAAGFVLGLVRSLGEQRGPYLE